MPFDVAPHDPTPIEFAALELDDRLRAGIADRGFERTTPIQSAVFPIVFAGGDLIACAETGTGKTAAFLLPLMQRLLASPTTGVIRGLVLAPTRELAVQIEDDFTGFSYHTTLTSVAVYGGVDGDIQARALRAGTDMVVATPGRLLDHMSCGIVDFSNVEVLILDEADRMLDMGFWPDVSQIVSSLPPTRQTLLFSATTSPDVVKLAEQVMRDPKLIQIGRAGGPALTSPTWRTSFRTATRPGGWATSCGATASPRWCSSGRSGLPTGWRRSGGPRHPVRGPARRPDPGRPDSGGRGVPGRPAQGAGGHRHRGARPRHRRHRARGELRGAARRRRVRAPGGTNGPGRGHRDRAHAGGAGRTAEPALD